MKNQNENKPSILFLHGACGSGAQFEPWARKLRERGYRVSFPDFRGHGKRDEPLHGVSVWDYVSDAGAFVCQLPPPVVVVGQSLGGLVAQLVVSQLSQLVKGCVLLSSTPDERPPFVWRSLKPRYLWAMVSGRAFHFTSSDARHFLGTEFSRTALYPESGKVIREELFGKCRVTPLTVPTLVFAAKQDRFFPLAVQRRIADKHNARFVEVNCGHMIHLSDEGDDVLRQLIYWIEQLDQ